MFSRPSSPPVIRYDLIASVQNICPKAMVMKAK